MNSQNALDQDRILIIGSGVFGLSLLIELLKREQYKHKYFTLISPSIPNNITTSSSSSDQPTNAAASLIASNDVNRIVRADYADRAYAELMSTARTRWLETPELASEYHESGLLLTAEEGTPAANYVRGSLSNVKSLQGKIQEFDGEQDIAKAMKASGLARATGSLGYLNEQSGWADAGASIAFLCSQVKELSRSRNVQFVRTPVQKLLFSREHRISGAITEDGETISADLTILATGAWTPSLIDTKGIASARGQCMAYVSIDSFEAEKLKGMPVHFNLSRGCFFFPPTKKPGGGWEIKVARHAFGYSNPEGKESVSVPEFPQKLPSADLDMLVGFAKTCLPNMDLDRRAIRTRMCWYLDTASSDFLACFHPDLGRSLFIATGGSGHAFKFLPVLGEKVANVMDGTDAQKDGGFWTDKWKWPTRQQDDSGRILTDIWCYDGSRAGMPGVTLKEGLAGDRRHAQMIQGKL